MAVKDKFLNKAIVYSDDTLVFFQKGVVSFVTLIPIASKQLKNYKVDNKVAEENNIEDKKNFLNKLQAFIPNRTFEKGRFGPVYKIITHYAKNTPLQKYLIDGDVEKRFDRITDKEEAEKESFADLKFKTKVSSISNLNLYSKRDFLSVTTMFPTFELQNLGLLKKRKLYIKDMVTLTRRILKSIHLISSF
jgi:hypothetical protein